jgi:hypothetical protein
VDGEGAEPDQDRVEIREDERLHRTAPWPKWDVCPALVMRGLRPISTAHGTATLLVSWAAAARHPVLASTSSVSEVKGISFMAAAYTQPVGEAEGRRTE